MGWGMSMSIGWPNATSGGTIPNATLYAHEAKEGLFSIDAGGKFTIEIWIRPFEFQSELIPILQFDNNPQNGLFLYEDKVSFLVNGISVFPFTPKIFLNQWTMICVQSEFAGGSNLWINGGLQSQASGTSFTSNGNIFIGSNGDIPRIPCHLASFRFSNTALYTSGENFTVPLDPLTPGSDTLLLCLQGNSLNYLLKDYSGNDSTLINNTGVYSSDNPFPLPVNGSLHIV
jgi:hypothetical protein